MGYIYHCGCVDDEYISPYQTRAKWLPWLLRKKTAPLYSNIGPWGPHTSTYGANLPLWMCKWSIPITIPNQSQVAAVVAKSRPFIFIYRPLGPIYFNIWGIFTIVGVWMIITYHHTKPEPIGCLGCWEKAGPLYFNIGPWGPHASNYGAYLPLWVCGWSLPITIPNQSHVAALVAKKKQALCI